MRFMTLIVFTVVASLLALTCAADMQRLAPPQKIASLNLCLDALLVKLVERERINSLTYLSGNPQFSPFSNQVKGIYLHKGLAEDLVSRNPDLILAGDFGAVDAITLLTQLGFRVERLPLPRTIDDIGIHIRQFGQLVGSETAAEKMVKNIQEKLVHLDERKKQSQPTTAFWYSSNGVVVGADTLENELMQRAGFYNLALDKKISGFAHIDLEELILAKPQVIIVESTDSASFSLASEYLEHPALRKQNARIITLPATLSVCSAPVVADVIETLSFP